MPLPDQFLVNTFCDQNLRILDTMSEDELVALGVATSLAMCLHTSLSEQGRNVEDEVARFPRAEQHIDRIRQATTEFRNDYLRWQSSFHN